LLEKMDQITREGRNLRVGVIGAVKAGKSSLRGAMREAGDYGVSLDTMDRWVQKPRATGGLGDAKPRRTFKKLDLEKLRAHMREHPDSYLAEVAGAFGCSESAIRKALGRLGVTLKKRGATASGDRSRSPIPRGTSAGAGQAGRQRGETGMQTWLQCRHGWSGRGATLDGRASDRKADSGRSLCPWAVRLRPSCPDAAEEPVAV